MLKEIVICIAFYIYFVNSVSFNLVKETETPKFCGRFPTLKGYYQSREFCCNYTIFNKTSEDGKQLACCNREHVYDPDKKICCGDQIRERTLLGGQTYACCGGNELYRLGKDGTCCNVTYHKHKVGPPWVCCGNRIYKNGQDRCCNGRLHPLRNGQDCCATETYNTSSSWCDEYEGTIHSYTGICDGQSYDKRMGVCCGDKLNNFTDEKPFLLCCGELSNSVAYYPKNYKCENNQAIPRINRLCGSEHYNPEKKLCCNETVHTLEPGMSCCGKTITNTETTDCCNRKPFDKRNEQCCGGNVISNIEKCCGGHKIGRQQVCCNGRPLNKTDKTECCRNRLYDKFTQKCVGGRITSINTTSAQCGQNLYNLVKDKCCNSRLHRGARVMGLQCCSPGIEIYNPNNESCCNGVVKNGLSCDKCGNEDYNLMTDRCCNSTLYRNATTLGLKCCPVGNKIYSPGKQTCRNGVVKENIRIHKRRHIDNCRRICLVQKRLMKNLACKKYVYMIQKKKTKKTRKGTKLMKSQNIFKVRKDMFSKKKFKGRKWSFPLDLKENCECINKNSKFVLGTDVFPPKTLEESHVIPFSRKVSRRLRSFKRRCKKS